jgi:hypothetical protein
MISRNRVARFGFVAYVYPVEMPGVRGREAGRIQRLSLSVAGYSCPRTNVISLVIFSASSALLAVAILDVEEAF